MHKWSSNRSPFFKVTKPIYFILNSITFPVLPLGQQTIAPLQTFTFLITSLFVWFPTLAQLGPPDCKNSSQSPFNFQASIAVLGDVFLRRANLLISDGKNDEGMDLVRFAKGTSEQLESDSHRADPKNWPDKSVMKFRLDGLAKLWEAKPLDDHELINSPYYVCAYD